MDATTDEASDRHLTLVRF